VRKRASVKSVNERVKKREAKFWNDFDNDDSMANDLLDVAVFLMGEYERLVDDLIIYQTKG
jgi:hypothetical protein